MENLFFTIKQISKLMKFSYINFEIFTFGKSHIKRDYNWSILYIFNQTEYENLYPVIAISNFTIVMFSSQLLPVLLLVRHYS